MDSIIVHQASKTGFVSKGALIALGKRAHCMSVNVSIGYVAYSLHILYLHVLCKMQSCGLGLVSLGFLKIVPHTTPQISAFDIEHSFLFLSDSCIPALL